MSTKSTPGRAWLRPLLLLASLHLGAAGACSDDDEGKQDGGRDGGADSGALFWYRTCGDPVCRADAGPPVDAGVSRCGNERPGQSCTTAGATCDPGEGCNVRLLCSTQDPTAGGCPISKVWPPSP